jgi:hypothetical protein
MLKMRQDAADPQTYEGGFVTGTRIKLPGEKAVPLEVDDFAGIEDNPELLRDVVKVAVVADGMIRCSKDYGSFDHRVAAVAKLLETFTMKMRLTLAKSEVSEE